MRTLHGAVFDLDGTILDSERIEKDAWLGALAQYGLTLSDESYLHLVGRRPPDVDRFLISELGPDLPIREIRSLQRNRVSEVTDQQGIPVKPGVKETLSYLYFKRLPLGIATSSPTSAAYEKLNQAGLLSYFSEIVGGDAVNRGKPAPDIYLKAASLLRRDPGRCVAFEDSLPGFLSARAAGFVSIVIPDLHDWTDRCHVKPDKVIPSLVDALGAIEPFLE